MGIFRRGTKNTSAEEIGSEAGTEEVGAEQTASAVKRTGGISADSNGATASPNDSDAAGVDRTANGPFDRSEVGALEGRLDLGSLWLTGLPGMELRFEVEQESQNVVGVTAVLGESAVQLQAFAAPRSEGIWGDIRTEIAASITSQGGTADMTVGPLGAELQARMPGQGPDGRTVFSPARFVGIDGPRWFLRAVLSGRAAIDEEAALALLDVVRATVVVRGAEAMAPRELLALRLPDHSGPATDATAVEEPTNEEPTNEEPTDKTPSLDDLKPFQRGPEITEIR